MYAYYSLYYGPGIVDWLIRLLNYSDDKLETSEAKLGRFRLSGDCIGPRQTCYIIHANFGDDLEY